MQKKYSIFIIIPFEEKFNQVFNDGIQSIIIPGYNLVIKRADMKLQGLKLVEHVHKHILETDFWEQMGTLINN